MTAIPLRTPVVSVPFASAQISPQARRRVNSVLSSGWLTTGSETSAFEGELASLVGADHAVAVNSCTAAIELALRALDLPAGSTVLTPTITFCGAVHAIVHAGLRPVLIDVDPTTLVPRPDQVAAAAVRHGAAAMVVQHMAGYPVPVRRLADAAGLPLERVIEDAAHGLGAAVGIQRVGSISAATCFSFYATKNLPIGEGGAITTNDPAFADRLRSARLHGMSRDAWLRYLPGGSWRYSVDADGLKANMSDLQAAIGRGQLWHFAAWQRRRSMLAALYDRKLSGCPLLSVPAQPVDGVHAWHLYVIRLAEAVAPRRDELIGSLAEHGIGTSVHFIPVHQFPYFQQLLGAEECAACPEAEAVSSRLLSLPLYPSLTAEEVGYVSDRLLAAVTELAS